jgi:DNA-binding LacI/PurR family transcriptional regulator
MAVTLKNIAQICGVDVSTVSRALRNDPRVREDTRSFINKKAAELGYNPNLAARHLVSGKTLNLWMIIPDLKQAVVQEPAQYLSESLNRKGYDLLITLYQNDTETFAHLMNRLSQNVADGAFIIPPTDYKQVSYLPLIQKKFPLVFIDRKPDFKECTTVTTANSDASANLVKKCLKAGAKKFVILFAEDNSAALARLKGSIEALNSRDIPFCTDPTFSPEFVSNPEPTAIIASSPATINDFYSNYSSVIKSDKIIAGTFDNWLGLSEYYSHIFVCKQDFKTIANQAAELMLRKIEEKADLFLTAETAPKGIFTLKAEI